MADEGEGKPLLSSAVPTPTSEDFEFQILSGGGPLPARVAEMCCAADRVFLDGRILPFHPSAGGPLPSRSDDYSMDHCSTVAISTLGLDASWSNKSSSRRSSNCVSRSHSSSSSSNYSNNFYAHPSPKPQLQQARRRRTASALRRSASSAPRGWGFLRPGLARAPPPQA